MCYVVYHWFHDMYTQEEHKVIDCVFLSKSEACEYIDTENDSSLDLYSFEEVPLYSPSPSAAP